MLERPGLDGHARDETTTGDRLRQPVHVGPPLLALGGGELSRDGAGFRGSRPELRASAQVDGAGGDRQLQRGHAAGYPDHLLGLPDPEGGHAGVARVRRRSKTSDDETRRLKPET